MSRQQPPEKARIDYMARRVPVNPRYAGVRAVTDTGASLSRHVDKINEIKTNFKYRKDEFFKRMKISTLVQLMVQVTEFNYDFPPEEIPSQEEMEDVRSTMQSVISGRGETTVRERAAGLPSGGDQQERRSLVPTLEVPYLLLDVREQDAYSKCHIITSLNYPSSRLARVMNFETPELLAYKNKEGRIIVLYDEEENLAPKVAQTFVERGYENLFLLSGGMKVGLQIFPIGLFFGTPPRHLLPNNNNAKGGGGGGIPGRSTAIRKTSSNPSIASSSSSSIGVARNGSGHRIAGNGIHNHEQNNYIGVGNDENELRQINGNDDNDDNANNSDGEGDGSILTQRNLNALKMALEEAVTPPEARMAQKTGRIATAASVGKDQRATANAKITARKEKLVGGREWK